MHRNLRRGAIALALLWTASVTAVPASGAQNAAAGTARPATKKVTPVYPEIARKSGLEGTVKLSVVVAPDGRVKSVAMVGGPPIFAVAATDAAKQWQFKPANKESTLALVFDFKSPDEAR